MEKADFGWEFNVKNGEKVVIRTHHVGVGAFATASNPAKEVAAPSRNDQLFEFTAKKASAPMESVTLTLKFPRSNPGGGSYDVFVTGDRDPNKDVELRVGKVRQASNAKGLTQKVRPILFHFV